MPIITRVGRQKWSSRLLVGSMYLILSLLGLTMVVPFMITMSSSFSNDFDYERFQPLPRFLWSADDRFARGLVREFNKYPRWFDQLACAMPGVPEFWKTWRGAGRDTAGIASLAATNRLAADAIPATTRQQAADYSRFVDQYPVEDLQVPVSDVQASQFLADYYHHVWQQEHPGAGSGTDAQALALLCQRWGLPLPSFYSVGFEQSESTQPYWQQSWFPPTDAKYRDFLVVKDMYRHHGFTPGVQGAWSEYLARHGGAASGQTSLLTLCLNPDPERAKIWSDFKAADVPAAPAIPFALRATWLSFLDTPEAHARAGVAAATLFDIATYNRIAGTHYANLHETPFPIPADAPPAMRQLWDLFVETRYPVRLTTLRVTPETTAQYQHFLEARFKILEYANRMLDTKAASWADFALSAGPPPASDTSGLRSVWIDFVKQQPAAARVLTSSEIAWQQQLLQQYGSLEKINAAYGTHYGRIEEAFPPFAAAYTVTFAQHQWSHTLRPLLDNYRFILVYLLKQGRAVFVTTMLILAAILLTLTVNPMCAYALSRFSLTGKDKIILYLLATMAFPAMISAIPAYLLMRDLGLLNTFFALLLPGAANGMAIFMLKGFFDSLPPELYEAATIDGAKEYQIFAIITLPLMKPILAINALNAFIAAYGGWEWALIICQKKEMWTLSVWMYQANQMWSTEYPWIVTAGFVVISIPTLVVFLFCQKIILQGIILPQMK